MTWDRAEVQRIARLCRLRLTATEEVRLARDLDAIVGYIDRLSAHEARGGGEASVGGRTPAPAEVAGEPPPSLRRELFLDNAPDHEDGFLVLPEEPDGE